MSVEAARFQIVEHAPLYGGSGGHRYAVIDGDSGVQLRMFRRRKDAERFLAEIEQEGLAGWQDQVVEDRRSVRSGDDDER